CTIGERAVGVAVDKLGREVRVEPVDVGLSDRTDVVMVEVGEGGLVRRARDARDDIGRLRGAGLRRRGTEREVRRGGLRERGAGGRAKCAETHCQRPSMKPYTSV